MFGLDKSNWLATTLLAGRRRNPPAFILTPAVQALPGCLVAPGSPATQALSHQTHVVPPGIVLKLWFFGAFPPVVGGMTFLPLLFCFLSNYFPKFKGRSSSLITV